MAQFNHSLNFQNIKTAINSMYRIFFNLCLKLNLIMLIKLQEKKKGVSPCHFEIYVLKAIVKGVLADHLVAMVTNCVTKMITMCSPMIGQIFDTMIIGQV